MRIYEIYEGKKQYWREDWREGNHIAFWSSFPKANHDKEDYFIIKALILFLSMRLSGINAKLELSKK